MSQIGAPLAYSYDYGEVARSILIAIAASYVALDLGGRITAARGRVRNAWLTGGAFAMGVGIWAMHFKGMLALRLPVIVTYYWPAILASLVIAVFASAIALYVATRQEMGPVQAWTGSLIMGAGIVGLHYTAMAAMRLPAVMRFSPSLVTLSVVLAILFSRIALMFTFDYREDFRGTTLAKLISAAVMGGAISLMHYTGMAAVSFIPTAVFPNLSHAVGISPLGNNEIVIVTLLILGAAIVTSSVDRQTHAEILQLNERLEQRVVERTRQLEAVNEELRRENAERQRAQDALRQSEDRLRLVLDTTPALIHSARPDGYVDYFNQRWLTYVGLPLEDLQGWGWTKAIHPEDLDGVLEKWPASLATGSPFVYEARVRRADGGYRWQFLRNVPLRDMHGNIVKWYGSAVDIEDRKRAEEARRRGETYLAMAQRIARMGVWSWSPSSGEMFGSEEFCHIFGIDTGTEKLTREVFLQRIRPEDRSRYEVEINSAVTERRNWELDYRIVLPDASVKYVHAIGKPIFNKSGDLLEFVGTTLDITERRCAEQELRQAEERIRAILEYSPNWIFLKDTEGRYLVVNREIEKEFGISQEQIKGKTDSEFFPPEQAAEYRANDLTVLRAGHAMEFEETAALEDGQHTSIVHKFPLFDTHGNIYATGGVATDITGRKKAEEARRQSEEQYRTVVETATDAVISIDEASQILLVNPATTKIFGYHSSELIGRPLTMLMPEFMREAHKSGVRRYLTTEQRHMNWQGVELIGQRANGEQFPVEVSFGEIRKQGRRIFTGFIRDITDRKQAEEALRSSERELHTLVEQLERERARLVEAQEVGKIGSWEVELQSLKVSWSKETHRIFETDPSLFVPTRPKFLEFIHPEDRAKVDAAFKRSLEMPSSCKVEYRIVMPDGRIKFVEESWQTFYDERGKPVRLAGTCHDVTERMRAAEEVRQLSGRLLRSHDEERRTIARDLHDSMGQDLVALATMLGQLHRDVPSSERKVRRIVLECKAWADRCIREIRTLSYVLHPPMLDQTGLEDAIRDFVKGFTKRSGIQVELELSPSLGRMEREIELALFRVVQESLTNIQRHSGSQEAKIRIHRNSAVTLEIRDLGRGAGASAPNVREELRFDFGVGISSMQERVKLVGGQFDIDSTSRGTTIRVTIPLQRNEHEKTAHSVGR